MKLMQNKYYFIFAVMLLLQSFGKSQVSGFIKTGVNFGFINKDTWHSPDYPEDFDYGKPLIRPILACGLEFSNKKVNINFSLMYQTKGQGSSVPRVRNLFQSESPDAIHFMSFPLGLKYKIRPKIYIGAAIQPSIFLGGTDNYYASTYWKGWIWSSVFSINYFFNKKIEIGFDYDYDFTYYYCDGCDDKFYTYRTYATYHFIKSNK
jgi:hypothetical protein